MTCIPDPFAPTPKCFCYRFDKLSKTNLKSGQCISETTQILSMVIAETLSAADKPCLLQSFSEVLTLACVSAGFSDSVYVCHGPNPGAWKLVLSSDGP